MWFVRIPAAIRARSPGVEIGEADSDGMVWPSVQSTPSSGIPQYMPKEGAYSGISSSAQIVGLLDPVDSQCKNPAPNRPPPYTKTNVP